MQKKYEFTGETKVNIFGKTLHRIRAIIKIDLGWKIVDVGELGGWIEKEENLSHNDNAWIYGNAEIWGNAAICGDARISGNARIYGNAEISGNARISDNASICGDARISGNAWIYGDAWISGNAEIYGNAEIWGDAWISGNARIYKIEHVLVMGPMGRRNSFTTFYRNKDNKIQVNCGCFCNTIDKFLEKAKETHGESKHALVYRAAVEVAIAQIDLNE